VSAERRSRLSLRPSRAAGGPAGAGPGTARAQARGAHAGAAGGPASGDSEGPDGARQHSHWHSPSGRGGGHYPAASPSGRIPPCTVTPRPQGGSPRVRAGARTRSRIIMMLWQRPPPDSFRADRRQQPQHPVEPCILRRSLLTRTQSDTQADIRVTARRPGHDGEYPTCG
jgi:hypothetical protein